MAPKLIILLYVCCMQPRYTTVSLITRSNFMDPKVSVIMRLPCTCISYCRMVTCATKGYNIFHGKTCEDVVCDFCMKVLKGSNEMGFKVCKRNFRTNFNE